MSEEKKVIKLTSSKSMLKSLDLQIEEQEKIINNKEYELGVYNGLIMARVILTGKDEVLKVFPPRLR